MNGWFIAMTFPCYRQKGKWYVMHVIEEAKDFANVHYLLNREDYESL